MPKVKVNFCVKRLLITLLLTIALPTSVDANDQETYSKECIIKAIEITSRNNDFVDARELQRSCACIGNNILQNLNLKSCPQYGVIEAYKIKRYFN